MEGTRSIHFDKFSAELTLSFIVGKLVISAESKKEDTYFYGEIPIIDFREVKDLRNGCIHMECDNTEVEIPKGYKELKDIIFIHSYKGTGYYGFILLGEERKLETELSLEDYRDFQSFIDKFIG